MLIGVDIGGTFTDLVLNHQQELHVHKLLSTPHNPAAAMLAGLAAVGAEPEARITHGSTVATNAILERKGARTALLTSQGFRDILAIGRQNRPDLYALHPQLAPPLIPRNLCYEVPERLDFRGEVITPLDIAALDRVLENLEAQQVEALAVCFLYSYLNPTHEQQVRQRVLERGFLAHWQISLSCEVLPEFREYERSSTTALDAYVRPVMSRYLQHLEAHLPAESRLLVMKSDGGVAGSAAVRQQAVQTALSGPAAGVIGAFHLAELAGFDHIITLDMGGTSTDVALCPGTLVHRTELDLDGMPLRMRLLDIETVGAGGGSLVRLDAGGALRVGPESAGADPGPIVYGRGGQQLSVSDANALLGRLDAEHFLGGQMRLHLEPARRALRHLADEAGLSEIAAALGIIKVANTSIERALRRVSVARGYDPREFTLLAFGGAGGLHACEVATRLGIGRVMIPRHPGVLCALGLLVADVIQQRSQTLLQVLDAETLPYLETQLAAMQAEAQATLDAEAIPCDQQHFSPLVDLRYQGQSYELSLPLSATLAADFHRAHKERYGYARQEGPLEVVTLRLQALGRVQKPRFAASPLHDSNGEEGYLGEKSLPYEAGLAPTALYMREKLPAGARLRSPCIIFQLDSTTFVPAGWSARVDAYHNLILEQASHEKK